MTPAVTRRTGNQGSRAADGRSRVVRRVVRAIGGFVAVLAAIVTVLAGLDRLPGLLADLPRGATRVAELADLERKLGRPVPLPVVYPDDLAWPPADLHLYPGPAALVIVNARASGTPALFIATAAPGVPALSPRLLPPVTVLQTSESTFGARRATVARLQDAGGAIWHEVSWPDRGTLTVVRYRGDVLRLGRMVETMVR